MSSNIKINSKKVPKNWHLKLKNFTSLITNKRALKLFQIKAKLSKSKTFWIMLKARGKSLLYLQERSHFQNNAPKNKENQQLSPAAFNLQVNYLQTIVPIEMKKNIFWKNRETIGGNLQLLLQALLRKFKVSLEIKWKKPISLINLMNFQKYRGLSSLNLKKLSFNKKIRKNLPLIIIKGTIQSKSISSQKSAPSPCIKI